MNVTGTPTGSRPLPPYRALVAVDAERFSRNRSAELPELNWRLQEILRNTLRESSVGEVGDIWQTRIFGQSTGDGYVFGTDTEVLPYLVDPWLDTLQAALADLDGELRRSSRDLRLRLRVSLHVGPVPDLGKEVADPVSTPTNEVFRLLDADPARRALQESNPDVTFLAAVVSQRVFEDVISAGYAGLHPDQFTSEMAEIPRSDFAQPAWLYVPRDSRRRKLEAEAPNGGSSELKEQLVRSVRPGTVSPIFHGDVSQANIADQIHGGIQTTFQHAAGTGRRTSDSNGSEDRP